MNTNQRRLKAFLNTNTNDLMKQSVPFKDLNTKFNIGKPIGMPIGKPIGKPNGNLNKTTSVKQTSNPNPNPKQKIKLFYIISPDSLLGQLFEKLLKPFGICYIIHSNSPTKTTSVISGSHFTNEALNSKNYLVYHLFVFQNPLKTLSNPKFWNTDHCLNIMYPNLTSENQSKLLSKNTINTYLNEETDWLGIENFYLNYLDARVERDYPIICVNIDKLEGLEINLNQLLGLNLEYQTIYNSLHSLHLKYPIDVPHFQSINQILDEMNPITIIPPSIYQGEISLNQINGTQIVLNIKNTFQSIRTISLYLNDIHIDKTEYSFKHQQIGDNEIVIELIDNDETPNEDYEGNTKINYIVSLDSHR
jgi:hypothetical protein